LLRAKCLPGRGHEKGKASRKIGERQTIAQGGPGRADAVAAGDASKWPGDAAGPPHAPGAAAMQGPRGNAAGRV